MPRRPRTPEEKAKERERLDNLKKLKDAEFRQALDEGQQFAVDKFKKKITDLIKWYVKAEKRIPDSKILAKAIRAEDPWLFQEFMSKHPDLKVYVNKELNKGRKLILEFCEQRMLELAFSNTKEKDIKARLFALEQIQRAYKSILSEEEEEEAIKMGADLLELIGEGEKDEEQ